jgi:hypothetical protein
MNKNKEFTHINVKDENGNDYLCPVDSYDSGEDSEKLDLNVCFEKDVPERYAGNISIRDS